MTPLLALQLRRALPRGYLLLIAVLLAFATTREWGASNAVLRALGGDASARAAARQGVWLLALLAVVPALVARAAATIPRWRAGESAWLGTRAIRPLACLAAALGGPALAGLLLGVLFFGAAELAAGSAPVGGRLIATIEHAPARLFAGAARATVALPALGMAGDDVLRLRLVEIPSDPAGAQVRVAVHAGGALVGARDVRVSGREVVDVPLERADPGELTLTLERDPASPHAGVVVPGASVLHLRRDASERRMSWALFARFALGLVGLSALALGLGAWMRASLAGLVTLSAWACAWAFELPGTDLAAAVRLAGDGIAPPMPGAGAVLGCALCVALGIALGRRGLWDGSGAP